jgi:tRNA(Ile)-lysidine synthase
MPHRIVSVLDQALAKIPAGAFLVAYSGGMDSSVLLHALSALPQVRERGLAAVHVDHGLDTASAGWAAHCARVAQALGVPCEIVRVSVPREGLGLEASARAARHAALQERLPPGGVLAMAHHADDQSETVLLKLLRGAGPEGLGGMRERREFARGWLWRPLLSLPRSALQAYAQAHGLEWIDDPSNADPALARNFLRADVLPRLRQHWPRLDDALQHAARHARAAAEFIDAQAAEALAQMQGLDPATLHWSPWLALPDALRDPVLRRWLRELELAEPTHLILAELERQLRDADAERVPCIAYAGTELRRHRELLYARAAADDPPPGWETPWDGTPLELPAGCGVLRLHPSPAPGQATFTVHFRRGGERLKPLGSAHTRELRDLFQSAGIPPWERPRLPLIYRDQQLFAVADLWRTEAADAWLLEHTCQIGFNACK